MGTPQVRLLDGSTFVVSDEAGDFGAANDDLDGLFYRDVRHLSRWQVLVNGEPMRTVATDVTEYDTAIFDSVEATPLLREHGELTLLPGAFLTDESATFMVSLAAGERWSTSIEIEVTVATRRVAHLAGQHPRIETDLPGRLRAMPRLETDWSTLASCYQRSLVDLAALRFYPDVNPRASLLAAGLPWYMALFGRDSLIASYETLPADSVLRQLRCHTAVPHRA